MKSNITTVIMTVLLSGSTAFVQAQTERGDSVLRHQELNPVVVTGTGTYHRADNSPVAVKVVTQQELQNTQASTLQEALTRLSSSITTHTNGMGTFLNFNGISDDYVVILENGRRVSGDDRWNRLSMDNVKRVEIFSGAASTLYGSDAIAGVINIITEDGRQPVAAAVGTRLMSKGRMDHDINVDVNVGRLSSQTSYTRHQAGNWQVNHYEAFQEEGTGQQADGQTVLKLTGRPMSMGFASDNISEKLEWRFSDEWSAYVRGSYYDYMTRRPQAASYFTQKQDKSTKAYSYTEKTAYTYDLHHISYLYGGGLRWVPNSRTHVYLDVYSDNFVSKYDYWQTAKSEARDETRKRTHYVNETLRGIFRLAEWNKLSAGLEMIQESLNSESDDISFETTSTYNVFAQEEVQLTKQLEAFAGLRYTQNDHFGAAFTPSVGLFFHVGGLRLRANYAGGYRTPTLSQLYATDQAKTTMRYTIFNHDLKPEKNHFLTANAEYGTHWMTASVTVFHNKIRDMINYRTMTSAEIAADAALAALQNDGWKTIRQRDNIDRATLKGISASLKLLLPWGLTLGGGYTYTDSKAETQKLDTKTQQYVTSESPVDKSVRSVGNVMASWSKAWKGYRVSVTIDGRMQGRRYSSTYGYADAVSQWNLNTRHTVVLKHCQLEPSLGIDNIFNQRDTSPWNSNFSTISPGRSLVAGLRVKY